MEILSKKSLIQIELSSDEVEALKHILNHYLNMGENYKKFASELFELIN